MLNYRPFDDVMAIIPRDSFIHKEKSENGKMPPPYTGIVFAEKRLVDYEADEYISYLSVDKDVPFEESVAKKIIDSNTFFKKPIIGIKNCIKRSDKDNDMGHFVRYICPLYYPEHPMFKESIHDQVSNAINVNTDITVEIIFAFDNGFVFPVYVEMKTGGTLYTGTGDIFENILNRISSCPEEFLDSLGEKYMIRKGIDNKDGFTRALYCTSRCGDEREIKLDKRKLRRLKSNTASMRVIKNEMHVQMQS